jgi:hypothetical protein
LILIWSPITSAASSASGPNHLKFISSSPARYIGFTHRLAYRVRQRQTGARPPA